MDYTDADIEYLNRRIRSVYRERGLRWHPEESIHVARRRDGRLGLADHNESASWGDPLTAEEIENIEALISRILDDLGYEPEDDE